MMRNEMNGQLFLMLSLSLSLSSFKSMLVLFYSIPFDKIQVIFVRSKNRYVIELVRCFARVSGAKAGARKTEKPTDALACAATVL